MLGAPFLECPISNMFEPWLPEFSLSASSNLSFSIEDILCSLIFGSSLDGDIMGLAVLKKGCWWWLMLQGEECSLTGEVLFHTTSHCSCS